MPTRIHWVYQLISQRIYNWYIGLKYSFSMASGMEKRTGGWDIKEMFWSYLSEVWPPHLNLSCLTVANIPIHVLSCLNSISILPASFALQDQRPFSTAVRPHSSIPSPSLSLPIFPVWTPNIFSPWHPNPRLSSLLSLSRFPPFCLVLKCHWLASPPITSYTSCLWLVFSLP